MSVTCARCGGPIIEIEMASGEAPLVMRSCSKCDARAWSSDGREIDLSDALRELAESGPQRRRRA